MQGLSSEFPDYLVSKWGGNFHHGFQITKHPAWRQWRCICPVGLERRWECSNLREAAERYSWHGEETEQLVTRFQRALQRNDALETKEACLGVFKWGGVARKSTDPSRLWLCRQADKLPQEIKRAVTLLKDPASDLSDFNGTKLLMNSAMTKVYWAADADKQIAIYDGRVGAALGLLAREFLKSKDTKNVPSELQFRWGGSRDTHVSGQLNKRNPSQESLRFPSLFTSARKDYHHARMMRDASFLLRGVASKLNPKVDVHDIEKALFMIGYDVRGTPIA